jgi:hypothetical protein
MFQAYLHLCYFVLGLGRFSKNKILRAVSLKDFEQRFGVQATVRQFWPVRPTENLGSDKSDNLPKNLGSDKSENLPKNLGSDKSENLPNNFGADKSENLPKNFGSDKSAFGGKMTRLTDKRSKKVLLLLQK